MAVTALINEESGVHRLEVSQCPCGAAFTRRAWRELPAAGTVKDGLDLIELRRCPCLLPVGSPSPRRR